MGRCSRDSPKSMHDVGVSKCMMGQKRVTTPTTLEQQLGFWLAEKDLMRLLLAAGAVCWMDSLGCLSSQN